MQPMADRKAANVVSFRGRDERCHWCETECSSAAAAGVILSACLEYQVTREEFFSGVSVWAVRARAKAINELIGELLISEAHVGHLLGGRRRFGVKVSTRTLEAVGG